MIGDEESRRGVEKLLEIGYGIEKLQSVAAELPSDVPHMDEEEYFVYVREIMEIVQYYADDFRNAAEKALKELVIAQRAYNLVTGQADRVFELLDEVANLQQTKHKSLKPRDIDRWRDYAIRVNGNYGIELAMLEGLGGKNLYAVAWNAANSARVFLNVPIFD